MQDNYRQQLTGRFVETVEYLNRQMYSGRLDEWQGLDMTLPQVKTLILLDGTGPLRMGSIASHLGSAVSATTSIVDRLVEKEMVERLSDPNDRRVVMCQLTDRGREATQSFWRLGRERVLMLVGLLDMEQLETVVQALELIRRVEEKVQETLDLTRPSG